MGNETNYSMTDFEGVVVLKDWYRAPDGRSYIGFVGKVSVIEAAAMTGFDIGKAEANWVARVESPDKSRSLNFPGCQVRCVETGWSAMGGNHDYLDLRS